MRALVTGATGFIGSAVARALIADGYRVRALVRPSSNQANLAGLDLAGFDLEIVEGDLVDAGSLLHAATGMDIVFHVAADYRLWVPDPDVLYKINVHGTRELFNAARLANVKRVVYTSSVATLGLNDDGTPSDETTPVMLTDMIGHYKRSKYLAEQIAFEAAADGQDVVIVNPAAPVGPRDIRPTPTGKTILDAAAGRMPAYVDTGLNIVHVDDVAQGHLLAAKTGQSGRHYVLGSQNMSLGEIFKAVGAITGRRAPRLKLPVGLILPVAHIAEAVARVTNKAPMVTVDGVRLARKKMYFSSQRAMDELGYRPRPAIDGLRDAVSWFKENNYL